MPDDEFLLLGDALWLEFVNTAGAGRDRLPNPGAYLRWTKAVRVEAAGDPETFAEAIHLRTRLAALAEALTERRAPPPSSIEAINRLLVPLEGREQLVRIGGHWRLKFGVSRPPRAVEAVAQSAAQTLANPLAVVRRCANPDCGLFLADESASQSRRWCSRNRCGQRGRIERRRSNRITPIVADE